MLSAVVGNGVRCNVPGCLKPGVVCVKGEWFCFEHNPVVFSESNVRHVDEDVVDLEVLE